MADLQKEFWWVFYVFVAFNFINFVIYFRIVNDFWIFPPVLRVRGVPLWVGSSLNLPSEGSRERGRGMEGETRRRFNRESIDFFRAYLFPIELFDYNFGFSMGNSVISRRTVAGNIDVSQCSRRRTKTWADLIISWNIGKWLREENTTALLVVHYKYTAFTIEQNKTTIE